MALCRVYLRRITDCVLYTQPSVKVKILSVMVVFGSVICSISFAPETCFDDRNNLINRVFVRFSWAWTLLFLLPMVALSSYVYEKAIKMDVLKNLLRVAVAHAIWYVLTTAFVLLDHAVGTCANAAYEYKHECHKSGSLWHGFDISGHTFLLSYCILIVTEEAIPVRHNVWQQAGNIISNMGEPIQLQQAYYKISPVMGVLRLYGVVLILLSALMTLTTNLYFHTMPEKSLGFIIAVLCWYVTYHYMYGATWLLPQPDYTMKKLFSEKHLVYSRREQL